MIWHGEEKILYESFYGKPNRGKLRERMAETPESSAKWAVAGCTKGRKRFPGTWENIAVGSSFRAERRTVRARWCCWEKGLSGTGCGSIHLIASRGKMFHVEHCEIFMAPAQEDRNRRGPLLAAGRGSPFWRRRHSRRAMASGGPRHLFWRGR